ncbi:MAG TPA: hypothetical protein DDX39_11540 [Bacteroidales bacterium]|nr:MAG: hypothetical protein A2W98_14135 [Bacteroidetes bacterium GWF2_33_38]OFY76512.1 MAG: hypothetical protein A2265_09810 [Bacteroidetes bacterium RIFOXYA12_FULL_33_9]HBF89263.1 hypothetical protein [Bacteroidales bacterium]
MKKLYFLLIFSCFLLLHGFTFAQTTIFQEDFEDGGSMPSGWTNVYVNSTVDWSVFSGGYSSYPASAYAGSYNALFYSGNYDGDKTKLVTSAINLSGFSNIELSFYHAQVVWAGDLDTLRVYYKTSLGGTWNHLASYTSEASAWTLRTLVLPSNLPTCYIGFEGHSGYGYGVCIDNVEITGIPIDVADEISINLANNAQTFNTCNAIITDDGGASGIYSNNQDYSITISSTNGGCVRAVLDYYHTEKDWDFIYFYDGPNTSSTQIGERVHAQPGQPFSTMDKTGNAYYALSGYLTIRFTSDVSNGSDPAADGFIISVSCPENCVAPTCEGADPAGGVCEEATPICNLDGYCGNTSATYPTDHEEIDAYNLGIFCGGINNNSWLSFVADSTTAILDVWVKNCNGQTIYGDGIIRGIQLQVYETECAYGAFEAKSNCWSPNEQMNGQIIATNLTVGNPYLIMIDGYASDVCEYTFAASSGIVVASAGNNKTICEGEYTTLTASGGTNVLWTASPSDPSLNGQESNLTISVTPSQTTTYTAEVWGSNSLCSAPADAVVFVNSADANFTGLDNLYCENANDVSLAGNFATGVFSGSGISGSTFSPSSVSPGFTNIFYTYNYSVVTVFEDDFDSSPLAGWTHGYSDNNPSGTHTRGDSWAYGDPKEGFGQNSSTENPDPKIDHTSNVENNVYGQGLGVGVHATYTDIYLGGHYHNSFEWLVSPTINCSGLTNTTLSFWRYANFEPSWDEAYLEISNTNGASWVDLGEELYPADDHWIQRVIDISAYADNKSQVKIRWSSKSDNYTTYSGWNIDDVVITGVQSGGSCVSSDIQTTYVNSEMTATASKTNITCNGLNNGTASVSVSGGTVPYIYTWSNGASSSSLSGLSAGTYYVTISDFYGICQDVVKSVLITEPSAIAVSPAIIQPICGQSNGSISLIVSNGQTPYSYVWSSGESSSSISSKSAGSYTVTVSDANTCQVIEEIDLNDSDAPTATASITATPQCNGDATGAATVSVSGGTAPYFYSWSGGSGTTQSVSGLAAGNYTVTVSDTPGCQATSSISITEPTTILLTTSKVDVLCYDNSTGSINLSVSGGTSPYTYLWSNGATSQDISTLAYGTYSVTVSDAHSCTKSTSLSISQPSAISIILTPDHVECNGGTTGGITATISGGTTIYSYAWSSGQSSQNLSNIQAGLYILTVTDFNLCTKTSQINITEPDEIVATSSISSLLCYDDADGSISVDVTGGVLPYTYAWSSGQTIEDLSSLTGGSYTLTITDANLCKEYLGATIVEPNILSSSINVSDVLCNGQSSGDIDLTVSGGTVPYNYEWNTGAFSQDLLNVLAGNYQVTITDANNCTSENTGVINQPIALTASTSSLSSTCGAANGSATVSPVGGTSPYTYLWSSGQTSYDISGLSQGGYQVTVTDANTCIVITSASVNDDNAAVLDTSFTNINCYGDANGAASVQVISGGTSPFTYIWSTGATTNSINGLNGGSYSVTVTDENTCSSSASITVFEPTQITINPEIQDVKCFDGNDGRINLSVSGGTGTVYSYSWSNSASTQNLINLTEGVYDVTVQDANSCTASTSITIDQPDSTIIIAVVTDVTCDEKTDGEINQIVSGGTAPYTYNWSNSSTSENISNIAAGTYSVVITDFNSCQETASYTVNQPDALVISENHTNILCYGSSNGTASINVSGGTTPYTYLWSNGQTSTSISSLSAGQYYVTIFDDNNCQTTQSYEITAPSQLIVNQINGVDVACNGTATGSINLTISGGVTPYTYFWNNGDTTKNLSNIVAGTYIVTITDANGCFKYSSQVISEPGILSILSSNVSNITCKGDDNGTITVSATGGSSPYVYAWSNGDLGTIADSLGGGIYSVTITDSENCEIYFNDTITEPSGLSSVIVPTHITCNGEDNGVANLFVSGGTAPYDFHWSTGYIIEDVSNLDPGTYTVTVSDANNCLRIDSVTIQEPDVLKTEISYFTEFVCFNLANGYAQVDVSGGTEPYSFIWSDPENQSDTLAENLTEGLYYVTIIDNHSCSTVDSALIIKTDKFEFESVVYDASCYLDNDGAIALSVSGTTSPYTYLWNTEPVQADSIASGLVVDEYIVIITDKYGCELFDTISVASLSDVCLEIPNCFTPNEDNINDTWEIKGVKFYPEIYVEIYTRWGELIYTSDGYDEEWDATYKSGKEVPMGSFVYIIDLGDGSDALTGTVTVIR